MAIPNRSFRHIASVCAIALSVLGAAEVAAAAPAPAKPAGQPHTIAPEADGIDLGADAAGSRAILIDSVRHHEGITSYVVQKVAPGSTWAAQDRYVADCARKLRAFQPDDAASGARLAASHVAVRSPEAHEIATACAMPQGPRTRWFAGFVMTADGVVAAPHMQTARCASISTGAGAYRLPLQLIGHEDGVTLLRMPGPGTWTVMPSFDEPSYGTPSSVTMMGVSGTAPRVSVGFVTAAGSNPDDSGWPQVLTLKPLAMNEGLVWNGDGAAIGLALASAGGDSKHAFIRMLPAGAIRARLSRHGLQWQASGGRSLDPEAAMRLALAATVPLFCEREH